jgi:O-antigen/teichoic acid export membrane protein
VRSLVYSATWVLSPTASEMETRGEQDKLHAMMIAGSRYSVLLSWPVLLGLVIFGSNLLTTWVGDRYAGAANLLTILAVPTLLSLPQSSTSAVLFGVSRHRGAMMLSLLNAVLNLVLSLLWVKPFGLVGVAMGTAVPLALVSGLAGMVYGCHALRLPFRHYFREGMLKPGLATLGFVVPALIAQWTLHPVGWAPLLGTCAACWLVFAVCAWRLVLDKTERGRWGRMLRGLFSKSTS